MYILKINIIPPSRRFYDLRGSDESSIFILSIIHMAIVILPSSTIFGTNFSARTEIPIRIVSNRACQSPQQIAGSDQARSPCGDTIFRAPERFKCIEEIPTSIRTGRTDPLPLPPSKRRQRSAEAHETRRQNHAPRTLSRAVLSNHY